MAAPTSDDPIRQTPHINGIVRATRDWRSVVGISKRTEFSDLMDAEIQAYRDAEQKAIEAESDE